jgi:hypothetical protein
VGIVHNLVRAVPLTIVNRQSKILNLS